LLLFHLGPQQGPAGGNSPFRTGPVCS